MSLRADESPSSRPRPAGLDLLKAPRTRGGGLFSWTVVESLGNPPDLPHLGAVGVSDDRGRAMDELAEALRGSPCGAFGLLHKVVLNQRMDGYCYNALITAAHIDAETGVVVTAGREPSGVWGPLSNVFTEIMRAADVQPAGTGAT